MQEDLAVGIGQTAVDRVAAHDGDDGRILLGLVLPEDLAVVVEVERIDGVRERRVQEHHVPDDERRALVPAQDACREGPRRRELMDVVRRDLLELGERRAGEVLPRHHPLLRVILKLHQFIVGEGVACAEKRSRAKQTCKQEFAHSSPPMTPSACRATRRGETSCRPRAQQRLLSWDASAACHDRA